MKRNYLSIYNFGFVIVALFVGVAFWLYSRFTVDDAFITWRYGENFVNAGVWGYNPSKLDLTQAYTNPIFAVLSLIPAALNINVVLFFKIVAVFNVLAFSVWFILETKKSWIMLLLLLALPATVIHAFGGLETFLFVALLSALMVSLDKNKAIESIIITLLLFATRPEAWLLLVLVPSYFLIEIKKTSFISSLGDIIKLIRQKEINLKLFVLVLFALLLPLVSYFLWHKWYFGFALPNTFYAKSGGFFSPSNLLAYVFFMSPLFIFALLGRVKIFFVMAIFFGAIGFKYSISNLQMDYSARFAFHIFFPVYVFLVYFASNTCEVIQLRYGQKEFSFSSCMFLKVCAAILLLAFAKQSGIADSHMVNYYPRALDSHAALGKTLRGVGQRYGIDSFAFGDAGMAAYHSGLVALDNIGLGSAKVVHEGLTSNLLDEYGVDLIAFHSRPEKIRLKDYNQEAIYNWSQVNNFEYICDIYWQPDYTLKIYSKRSIPEVNSICESSKRLNDRSNREYLKETLFTPPWKYWK